MPYKDSERQTQYYRERQERRKTDPEYIERRRKSFKHRYDNDPEFRHRHQQYQSNYRKQRRSVDPEYRERERVTSERSNRMYRGITITDKQRAEFENLTHCEVCSEIPTRRLHVDHCHSCNQYRGGLCAGCNTHEGVLRKWQAVCPIGSPMRKYLDRHTCGGGR